MDTRESYFQCLRRNKLVKWKYSITLHYDCMQYCILWFTLLWEHLTHRLYLGCIVSESHLGVQDVLCKIYMFFSLNYKKGFGHLIFQDLTFMYSGVFGYCYVFCSHRGNKFLTSGESFLTPLLSSKCWQFLAFFL